MKELLAFFLIYFLLTYLNDLLHQNRYNSAWAFIYE